MRDAAAMWVDGPPVLEGLRLATDLATDRLAENSAHAAGRPGDAGRPTPTLGDAQPAAAVSRAARILRYWARRCWRILQGAASSLLRARNRRRNAWLATALVITGPVLAVLTYSVLSSADISLRDSRSFQLLIVADLLYLLIVIGLIALQITRLLVARRERSAGSKMHLRMATMFAGVAAAPTLLVAAFFFLVIQLGFDAWFSEQVGSVVRNSRDVAQAYAEEHRSAIRGEAVALAQKLNAGAERLIGGANDPRFPILLEAAIEQSTFSDVYVVNSSADVVARGSLSFLFAYTPPSIEELSRARMGAMVINQDLAANEMRALVRLDGLFDAFLYVSRPVDGEVLSSLEQTSRSVSLYNRLEQNRDRWLAQFAAIYLGFAVLVVMAAIYLGLWFAERLARPVGRLAAAAQQIREGDLFVRVKEERGEDEIALLSRAFNSMTEEVKRKQDALTVANEQLDDRRRFTEAVLSGVTAGVIGLDGEGRIRLMTPAASRLLDLDPATSVGQRLADVAPECRQLLDDAAYDPSRGVERPLRLLRGEQEREVLARVTRQRPTIEAGGFGAALGGGLGAAVGDIAAARDNAATPVGGDGYVVTLDDLTALVAAERMAAWGDVARRIAHEIKNPLTPIQLAAERLKRKYAERMGEDGETFERYTETIVRQTGDIRRMVDAFVRFAKMPSPRMAVEPLAPLVKEAVLLQEEGRADIAYSLTVEPEVLETPSGAELAVRCDRGQLTQALTNMLQNAADAIHSRRTAPDGDDRPGEIRVAIARAGAGQVSVTVSDNGIGLPTQNRRRLLEPYVTTREKGAGLGLAIVSKIAEEHSALFELIDAHPFAPDARPGAAARLTLPIVGQAAGDRTPAVDAPETVDDANQTAQTAPRLEETDG